MKKLINVIVGLLISTCYVVAGDTNSVDYLNNYFSTNNYNHPAWVVSIGGSGQSIITEKPVSTYPGSSGGQWWGGHKQQAGPTGDLAVGFDVSIGRTGEFLLPVEYGVRQGITFGDNVNSIFDTRVYADWTVFTLFKCPPWWKDGSWKRNTWEKNDWKEVDLFVGTELGITYGDIQAVWNAGPEVGLRWWVRDDVSVLFRTEFPFRLSDGADYSDVVRYFLGFQIKFN